MQDQISTDGNSGISSTTSRYFSEVRTAAENVSRLLQQHRDASGESGFARYAVSIASTVIDLCEHAEKAAAEDAIEIAEMLPKLLRLLWTEIDAVLKR